MLRKKIKIKYWKRSKENCKNGLHKAHRELYWIDKKQKKKVMYYYSIYKVTVYENEYLNVFINK